MEAHERRGMAGGSLPERSLPDVLGEMEVKVDEALATARASEAAVMTVGAAAFDAADQARRAAELAERASAAMLAERTPPPTHGSPLVPPDPPAGQIMVSGPAPPRAEAQDSDLREFSERADRVLARLRALEDRPVD